MLGGHLVTLVVTFIIPFETPTSKVLLLINTPWFIPHPHIEALSLVKLQFLKKTWLHKNLDMF